MVTNFLCITVHYAIVPFYIFYTLVISLRGNEKKNGVKILKIVQTKQIGRDFSLSLILSLKVPSRAEYNQVLSIY